MSDFILEQAWITTYTAPRICTCVQIPDKYPIVNVRIPYTMMNQSKPLIGSLVLVASMDHHKHYIIAVLREPSSTLNQNPDQILNSDAQFAGDTIQPGEVFLQAAGTPTQGTGNSAYLHITNSGTIELSSSDLTEQIIIGGESSDDNDHENVIRAPNVTIESPITTTPTGVQSFIGFDDNNNISISNSIVTIATSIGVPISEFTMDVLGNITLQNTTVGVPKGFLNISTTGNVQLGNVDSQLQFDPVGHITMNGPTINMNHGTEGAARIADLTISNISIDPLYWPFVNAIQAFFTALSGFTGPSPVAHSELGALGLAFLALVPTAPTSITSKISSGSTSVFIG